MDEHYILDPGSPHKFHQISHDDKIQVAVLTDGGGTFEPNHEVH